MIIGGIFILGINGSLGTVKHLRQERNHFSFAVGIDLAGRDHHRDRVLKRNQRVIIRGVRRIDISAGRNFNDQFQVITACQFRKHHARFPLHPPDVVLEREVHDGIARDFAHQCGCVADFVADLRVGRIDHLRKQRVIHALHGELDGGVAVAFFKILRGKSIPCELAELIVHRPVIFRFPEVQVSFCRLFYVRHGTDTDDRIGQTRGLGSSRIGLIAIAGRKSQNHSQEHKKDLIKEFHLITL